MPARRNYHSFRGNYRNVPWNYHNVRGDYRNVSWNYLNIIGFCRFVPGNSPGLGIGYRDCFVFFMQSSGPMSQFLGPKTNGFAVPGVRSAPLSEMDTAGGAFGLALEMAPKNSEGIQLLTTRGRAGKSLPNTTTNPGMRHTTRSLVPPF